MSESVPDARVALAASALSGLLASAEIKGAIFGCIPSPTQAEHFAQAAVVLADATLRQLEATAAAQARAATAKSAPAEPVGVKPIAAPVAAASKGV